MHTTYSDGISTPSEIVAKAREAGLGIISITDHDSLGALPEARRHGEQYGVEVISGIEFGATLNSREVHIIGYFVDPDSDELNSAVERFREERLQRAHRMVTKLNALNVALHIDAVLESAGEGAIGRPHIARALVNCGLTDSYYQAFNKYISDSGPAYERRAENPVSDIIGLISRAKGLSVLAHPGRTLTEAELLTIIRSGIDGIEVKHPSHTPDLVKYYRGIVNQYYLVETGGSDFHGGPKADDRNFGQYTISGEDIEAMERRLPVT